MIHKIFIDEKTDPKELKKLFRKKLMTGGAVIRLKDGVEPSSLEVLFEKFSPDAKPNNLHSMVLREISESPLATAELLEQIKAQSVL